MIPWLHDGTDAPLLIAEIGAKYGGMELMTKMVRTAAACGVDMVKFQTYAADRLVDPDGRHTFAGERQVSQYDFFKQTELTAEDHRTLDSACREAGVRWISTPSHAADLDVLEAFNPPAYKTGSDDLTNLPLLKAIAEKGRPVLMSTGMSTLGEVERAVETVLSTGNRKLVLLHCVVSYPSRVEDANLKAIQTLRAAFGLPVGLSDHTPDHLTSVLAVALGAAVIEKHFTLDHAMCLPDHEASLDPAAFRVLVEQVRMVPKALGDGVKRILPTESAWRKVARKSIVAARDLEVGTVLETSDLEVRRPGNGLHPHLLSDLIGRRLARPVARGAPLAWDMIGP